VSWKALAISAFLLVVVGAACSGGGEAPYTPQSANFPTDVPACQAFNEFGRYRYVHSFRWFSPLPDDIPDDADAGSPPFALFPNAPTLDFGQTYEGAIINPDRIDLVAKTKDAPDAVLRWVDGQGWTDLGNGWQPIGAQPYNFPPAQVCDAVVKDLDLSAATPSVETVADVEAEHYRFEQVSLDTATRLWEPQSDPGRLLEVWDVEVWLTQDGWPVRLQAKSQAQYPSGRDFFAELSLEISDVNSGDISIEPPTG